MSVLSWTQMHDIIIVSLMFTHLNFNNQIHRVERKSKRKQAQNNILHLILSRSLGLFLAFLMKRCLRSSLALGLCNLIKIKKKKKKNYRTQKKLEDIVKNDIKHFLFFFFFLISNEDLH